MVTFQFMNSDIFSKEIMKIYPFFFFLKLKSEGEERVETEILISRIIIFLYANFLLKFLMAVFIKHRCK